MHVSISRSVIRWALALAAACPAARAQAQERGGVDVTVRVRAEDGGAPLAGAQVELLGTRRVATANGAGVALLRGVPAGPTLFEVRKLGYGSEHFTVNVAAGDTLGIDVDLQAAPVRLRGVRATATARNPTLQDNGFYDRQQMGLGTFLTGRELERYPGARFTSAMRTVPGVRVVRYSPRQGGRRGPSNRSGMDVDEQYRITSSRSSAGSGAPDCFMDVYVDGLKYDQSLDSFPVSEVEAVEVYRGPSEAPPQFRNAASRCGVVVVWMKR
jgi:hypothetical protein